jgi:hypothetical protein
VFEHQDTVSRSEGRSVAAVASEPSDAGRCVGEGGGDGVMVWRGDGGGDDDEEEEEEEEGGGGSNASWTGGREHAITRQLNCKTSGLIFDLQRQRKRLQRWQVLSACERAVMMSTEDTGNEGTRAGI